MTTKEKMELERWEAWLAKRQEWHDERRNSSHCYDPTAYKAISDLSNEEKRTGWDKRHNWED